MLRGLGIGSAIKWFVIACIFVALYKGYHGNVTAIGDALWQWVNQGATVVTHIWHSINKNTTSTGTPVSTSGS